MRLNIVLFAAVLLGGCGGRVPLHSTEQLRVVNDNALPPPVRTDLVAQARESLIGPLDTISVDVFNVPDLSREVQVDSGGSISLPLIGTVDARGKTSVELARAIETALRANYVRNPEVTVNVKSSISQVVTVDGQVGDPGLYPVTNQMTLGRAIASAKGVSEFAKLDDVVILRTVNGQRMAGLYNLTAIRRGLYADPAVYPNDVILVGDSPARRLFKDFVSVTPLLAAPLIALIQHN
jgi:polysaccharide export outer membrane protein